MKKVSFLFLTALSSMLAMAQDKGIDVNINNKGGNNFWGSPWVWVIGAAVFILLLVALLSRGKSTE